MGIQTVVVFVGLIVALTMGSLAGTSEFGSQIGGWLVVGLVPALWTLLYVTERVIGREIWEYTAPYPYRWMEHADVAVASRLPTVQESEVTDAEIEDTRLAA